MVFGILRAHCSPNIPWIGITLVKIWGTNNDFSLLHKTTLWYKYEKTAPTMQISTQVWNTHIRRLSFTDHASDLKYFRYLVKHITIVEDSATGYLSSHAQCKGSGVEPCDDYIARITSGVYCNELDPVISIRVWQCRNVNNFVCIIHCFLELLHVVYGVIVLHTGMPFRM